MKRRFTTLAVVALLLAPAARAAEAKAAPPAPDPWKVTWEIGAEERVRSEALNNAFDWNDATEDHRLWYRFRTRVWGKATIGTHGEAYVGLNNESRKTDHPDTPFKWDEVIFENAWVDWKLDPAVSVRVGRQNLMKGEGFVLFDGTSGDGSRTAYFNAVDVTFGWKKSKVELIGISDPKQDQYLPVFNDKDKYLTEWDEQAVGLYYTGRDLPKTAVDGYLFWKSEKDDYRAATSAQFQPDRQFSTFGARVVQQLPEGFSVTAEAAAELGEEKPKPGATGANQRAREVMVELRTAATARSAATCPDRGEWIFNPARWRPGRSDSGATGTRFRDPHRMSGDAAVAAQTVQPPRSEAIAAGNCAGASTVRSRSSAVGGAVSASCAQVTW